MKKQQLEKINLQVKNMNIYEFSIIQGVPINMGIQ